MKKAALFALFAAINIFAAEFQLIATADLHGSLNSLSRLAPQIRAYPSAVKADIGDLFQGNVLSEYNDGMPMIDALNSLGFDIFVPGNHEFEFSDALLGKLQKRFNGVFLGAGWRGRHCRPLPWKIFKRGGIRCAMIGMTEPAAVRRKKFLPELTFENYNLSLPAALSEIKKFRPDIIILLRHAGIYSAAAPLYRTLQKYPEIDAVVCAHTHQGNPGTKIGRALVVQPEAHGKSAVLLSFSIDKKGRKRVVSKVLRPTEKKDAEISAITDAWHRRSSAELAKELYVIRDTDEFVRQAAEKLAGYTAVQAAAIDLPPLTAGSFTMRDLYTVFAYRNKLCRIRISKDDLKKFSSEKVPFKRRRVIAYPQNTQERDISVVMSDFQIYNSPTLRKKIRKVEILDLTERDFFRKYGTIL